MKESQWKPWQLVQVMVICFLWKRHNTRIFRPMGKEDFTFDSLKHKVIATLRLLKDSKDYEQLAKMLT